MTQLGRQLHKVVGSTKATSDIADEVAELNPRNWHTRIDIIDKNWDGIGGWTA